jgi:hypothetical protein
MTLLFRTTTRRMARIPAGNSGPIERVKSVWNGVQYA